VALSGLLDLLVWVSRESAVGYDNPGFVCNQTPTEGVVVFIFGVCEGMTASFVVVPSSHSR
jgi:hypothetical protein